jgi:hypothetical protein
MSTLEMVATVCFVAGIGLAGISACCILLALASKS